MFLLYRSNWLSVGLQSSCGTRRRLRQTPGRPEMCSLYTAVDEYDARGKRLFVFVLGGKVSLPSSDFTPRSSTWSVFRGQSESMENFLSFWYYGWFMHDSPTFVGISVSSALAKPVPPDIILQGTATASFMRLIQRNANKRGQLFSPGAEW